MFVRFLKIFLLLGSKPVFSTERMLTAILFALVLAFTWSSFSRNLAWNDHVSFWSDAVAKSPHKARDHYQLGLSYVQIQDYSAAERSFKKTLQLDPAFYMALNNLGSVYHIQGRLPEAERQFAIAIEVNPFNPVPHNNLGLIALEQRRFSEAERHYVMAIRLDPAYAEALDGLARVYVQQGRISEALPFAEKASNINPDSEQYRANLENVQEQIRTYKRPQKPTMDNRAKQLKP